MSESPPSPAMRLREQERPTDPVVMYQSWNELAFIHWSLDPSAVADSLPPRLALDCFDGRAWLGLVPFYMRRIRPRFLPPVPGLSWFLELNVRTYVYDRETGRPGVWFYSLDCNQSLAVWLARTGFHLPYHRAHMRATRRTDQIDYQCQRRAGGDGPTRLSFHRAAPEELRPATPSSLEFFLTERYRLYSQRRDGRLFAGQVHHSPYQIAKTPVQIDEENACAQAGFPRHGLSPDFALYSPGVQVEIFPLQAI